MKIGIFLKNSELSEFLSLECAYYGAEVETFTESSRDFEYCDILFFDSYANLKFLKYGSMLVQILYDYEKVCDERYESLRCPFLLSDVKKIIFKEYERKKSEFSENEKGNSSDCVIYLDEKNLKAQLYSTEIFLSDYELRILKRLCITPSTTVCRNELATLFEKATDGNMVDVYICRLRKKLESATKEKVIYTIRGEGYMTNYCIKEQNK